MVHDLSGCVAVGTLPGMALAKDCCQQAGWIRPPAWDAGMGGKELNHVDMSHDTLLCVWVILFSSHSQRD